MSANPSTTPPQRSVPRLLLTRQEAAELLGMSLRSFERHVQPHVACVYIGQLRQYRPADLERWIAKNLTTRETAA